MTTVMKNPKNTADFETQPLPYIFSPMLRCVANDMNRWEIFPSLLISTSIS